MHTLQINASYKPAYIYGGPTMSVSKLSEELVNAGQDVEVLTTTANGKEELIVKPGEKQIIDGVPVTYFRRLTKDHSHFSPALLIHLFKLLNKETKNTFLPASHNSKPTTHISSLSDSSHNSQPTTHNSSLTDSSHNSQPTTHNSSHNSQLTTHNPSLTESSQYSLLNTHYSIIHIHAWWNLVSVLSCLIAVWKGSTVILSPRGTLSSYSFGNRNSFLKRIFHKLIGKPLLEKCHIHATSQNEKTAILSLFNPKSITVIPNFVRLPNIEHGGVAQEKVPLQLIFMSRIEEKKGLNILLEALSLTSIPFYLTIAGTGEKKYIEQLKKQASELGIINQIKWIGHQADSNKFRILKENDLFILCSHDESFANIVIESLSVGTAVLISEEVGLADYVIEKQFGWISKNTPHEFRKHLENIYKEKHNLHSIRTKAPEQVRSDFNEAILIEQYIRMYQEISTNSHS